jgi:hypothetical protein
MGTETGYGFETGTATIRRSRNPRRSYTREQLLDFLRSVIREVGPVVRAADIERITRESANAPSRRHLDREFGSLSNAVRLAGGQMGKVGNNGILTMREEIEQFIASFSNTQGAPVTMPEYDAHRPAGYPSARRVMSHYGGWYEAHAAAGTLCRIPSDEGTAYTLSIASIA